MAKRGQNEGSIYRRADGRWVSALSLLDGKRKQFYGTTRKQVADKLAQAQHRLQLGVLPSAANWTVADELREYLALKEGVISSATHYKYRLLIKKHLEPGLGKIQLIRLTPVQIHHYLMRGAAGGFSRSMIRDLRCVLSSALKKAVQQGRLLKNPAADLERIATPSPRQAVALNQDQAQRLFQEFATSRLEALFVLALTTGLRRGELMGLRWGDIDLEARGQDGQAQPKLSVCRQITRTHKQEGPRGYRSELQPAEPKTTASKADVSLPERARAALARRRAQIISEGVLPLPTALVFTRQDLLKRHCTWRIINRGALPLQEISLTREFNELVARAGLPPMHFHDLRHSAGRIAMDNGATLQDVSAMLRHANPGITAKVYLHGSQEGRVRAAAAMDRAFGR